MAIDLDCEHDEAAIVARLDALIEEAGAGVPFMVAVSEDLPREAYPKILPILGRYFGRKGNA